MVQPPRSTIVYDRECGPCASFKRTVEFLDPKRQIEFLSLSEAEKMSILSDVPESIRARSFHLVKPDGRVESGAQALPGLARLLPAGSVTSGLMTIVPGAQPVVGWLYLALSRLHSTCSR